MGDKLTDKRLSIEEEIMQVDNQINEKIYSIYGLTKDEQKIIEKSIE
ncbi:MAG: hypothetical protein ACREAE_05460 [Nitrosopumilaceae archaeon]